MASTHDLRAQLEAAVIADLLGPAGGPEEIVDERTLRDRYLVGKLGPRGQTLQPDEDDPLTSDDIEGELDEGGVDGEDGVAEARLPAAVAVSMQPASLGLSFVVAGEATALQLTARWGRYERVRVEDDAYRSKDGSLHLVWRRIPVEAVSSPMPLRAGKTVRLDTQPRPARCLRPVPCARAQRPVACHRLSDQRPTGAQEGQGYGLALPAGAGRRGARRRGHLPAPSPAPGRPRPGAAGPGHALSPPGGVRRRPWRGCPGRPGPGDARPRPAPAHRRRAGLRAGPDPPARRPRPHPGHAHPQPGPRRPLRRPSVPADRRLHRLDRPPIRPHPASPSVPPLSPSPTLSPSPPLPIPPSPLPRRRPSRPEPRPATPWPASRPASPFWTPTPRPPRPFASPTRPWPCQRIHTIAAARVRQGQPADWDTIDQPANRSWRTFQLAFLLLNLPALANPTHPERRLPPLPSPSPSPDHWRLADLLWFPTGGGKTEAYLGVAAFTMAIRRLQGEVGGRSGHAGVAVLMRYTLRLLTLQQFQRAAALICACEHIRRSRPALWGDEPFRLGLWVGQRSTPNWTNDAAEAVKQPAQQRPLERRHAPPAHQLPLVRRAHRPGPAHRGQEARARRRPHAHLLRRSAGPVRVQPAPQPQRGHPGRGGGRGDLPPPAHPADRHRGQVRPDALERPHRHALRPGRRLLRAPRLPLAGDRGQRQPPGQGQRWACRGRAPCRPSRCARPT